MIDLKQAVAAFLTLGMLAMLVNMMSNGPFLDADQVSSEEKYSNGSELRERSPTVNRKAARLKELWGRPGPVLEPCWDKHITHLKGKLGDLLESGFPMVHTTIGCRLQMLL